MIKTFFIKARYAILAVGVVFLVAGLFFSTNQQSNGWSGLHSWRHKLMLTPDCESYDRVTTDTAGREAHSLYSYLNSDCKGYDTADYYAYDVVVIGAVIALLGGILTLVKTNIRLNVANSIGALPRVHVQSLTSKKKKVALILLACGTALSIFGALYSRPINAEVPESANEWRVHYMKTCCPDPKFNVCKDTLFSGGKYSAQIQLESLYNGEKKTNLYSYLRDRKECAGASYTVYYAYDVLLAGGLILIASLAMLSAPTLQKTWFYRKRK
jgi:hypothetical protein